MWWGERPGVESRRIRQIIVFLVLVHSSSVASRYCKLGVKRGACDVDGKIGLLSWKRCLKRPKNCENCVWAFRPKVGRLYIFSLKNFHGHRHADQPSSFPLLSSNFPSRPNHPQATFPSPPKIIPLFRGIYARCKAILLRIQWHRSQMSKQASGTPSLARRSTQQRNLRPSSYSYLVPSQGSAH